MRSRGNTVVIGYDSWEGRREGEEEGRGIRSRGLALRCYTARDNGLSLSVVQTGS